MSSSVPATACPGTTTRRPPQAEPADSGPQHGSPASFWIRHAADAALWRHGRSSHRRRGRDP
eukprot:scaffold251_cov230-Pinguiococcus_pyrenoidosus.AAC.8